MRIGEQILATPSSYLARSTSAIQRSLERLSSGKRVNSAADDSAAFSAGIRLDSQARGLKQGLLNINQSQSLLEVADSAYSTQLDLIQRMREIAVEASNGTLTTADRTNLNKELNALVEEFQRIATQTEFNGRNLIDGSFGTLSTFSGLGNSSIDQGLANSQLNQMFKKTAGTGVVTSPTTYTLSTNPNRGVEIGDFNKDGNLDALFTNLGSDVFHAMLGNGDGTFQTAITSYGVEIEGETAFALGDVTGDGIIDVVTTASTGGVAINAGLGDGRFQFRSTYGTSGTGNELQLGDIDGDGDLDIVSADSVINGNLAIFLNDGTGAFSFAKSWTAASGSRSLQLADFNGDGRLDIVTTNQKDISIELNQGGLIFTETTAVGLGAGTTGFDSLSVGDIDRDGDLDVGLVAVNDGFLIFLNSGTGNFTYSAAKSITTTSLYNGTKLVDINNDGILDVYGASSSVGLIYTAFGNGDGSFAALTTGGTSNGVTAADTAFGDFNKDGIADVIQSARNGASEFVSLMRTSAVSAVTDLSVSTQSKAQKLIGILDTALKNITGARSDISALHARLDSEASANLMLAENLSDALSRSQDVDVAEETSELVRNQILQQAQIAVMAQANTQAQVVLNLLRDL